MARKQELSPLDKIINQVKERRPRSVIKRLKKPSVSETIQKTAKEPHTYKTEGQICINHIVALRNADHVEFEYIGDGKTRVTCFTNVSSKKTASDIIKWTFDSTSMIWTEAGKELDPRKTVEAKYTARYTCYDWEFQTIVGFFELNDDLEFIWFQDGLSSVQSSDMDIHVDVLKLIIYRDEFRYHFIIGTFAGNNDVRMIKVNDNE